MEAAATTAAVPAVRPRRRLPVWAWDVLAGLATVFFSLVPFNGRPEEHAAAGIAAVQPWAIAIPVVAALLLPLRRRWPLPVLGAMLGLLIVGTVVAGSAFPFITPVAIATYWIAKTTVRLRTFIVVVILIVAITLTEWLTDPAGVFIPRFIPMPAIIAFAAAAGDAARSRRAFIDSITERAERAERTRESEARRRVAEERLRIARDLHDTVAHQMAVINLHAGVAARAVAADRDADLPTARDSLTTISAAARTVLGEIGDLLSVLRSDPPSPETDGAASPTPQPGLEQLDDLVATFTASGLDVRLHAAAAGGDLPATIGRVAYQVIREGLTNAHKHGSEHRAEVTLEREAGVLTISITNPVSPGLPAARQGAGEPHGGHGLVGLRERVATARGTIRTDMDESAFRLVAELPLTASGLGRDRGDA